MRGISAAQGLRVLDLSNNSIVCIEGNVFVECNEWFSSNQRPSYVHRILGSAGGKYCKSLKRIVQLKVFSPLIVILYLTQEFIALITLQSQRSNISHLCFSPNYDKNVLFLLRLLENHSFVWRNQKLIVI